MSDTTALTSVEVKPAERGAMTDATTSRQAQEVQAAMLVAQRFPRDEERSIARIQTACKRKGLAEKSAYKYPRGGKTISGPSIRLAETLAMAWGNLDFGISELDQRLGESDVMAYCWDLETNTRRTVTFTVPHIRYSKEKGNTRLSDPRDIYEMVANMGARRLRACILAVIPGDVQQLAVQACRKTLIGESTEPLVDRIRKAVNAFADFGVTVPMIEAKLGHKLAACEEFDLVDLREIWQSMKDGMSKRDDWFDANAERHADHLDQAKKAAHADDPEPVFDRDTRMAAFRKQIGDAKGVATVLADVMTDIQSDFDLDPEDRDVLYHEAEAAAKQP